MRTHAHTRAHMHTNTHARRLPGWRPWAELLGLVRTSGYALCLYMSTSLLDIRQSCSIGQGRYTRWAGQRLRAKPRRGTRDLANHPAGSRFESELEPLPRCCQPGCRWRWDPWPASLPPSPRSEIQLAGRGRPWATLGCRLFREGAQWLRLLPVRRERARAVWRREAGRSRPTPPRRGHRWRDKTGSEACGTRPSEASGP